jgi:hypothetical protein
VGRHSGEAQWDGTVGETQWERHSGAGMCVGAGGTHTTAAACAVPPASAPMCHTAGAARPTRRMSCTATSPSCPPLASSSPYHPALPSSPSPIASRVRLRVREWSSCGSWWHLKGSGRAAAHPAGRVRTHAHIRLQQERKVEILSEGSSTRPGKRLHQGSSKFGIFLTGQREGSP